MTQFSKRRQAYYLYDWPVRGCTSKYVGTVLMFKVIIIIVIA